MWDKARTLIHLNLERTNGAESWQKRLANIDYVQTGDKEGYIAAMEEIPGFMEDPRGKAWKALLRRDYRSALNHLEELDPGESLETNRFQLIIYGGAGLWLRPLNLLAALIRFELGEEEKWLMEAGKAKTYLEWILEEDPRAALDYLSNLMVCYALEGERERMESTIARLRERFAGSADWNYIHQPYHYTYRAIAYLVLGDNDAAIENLVVASQMEGVIFLNRELDLWFIFDRLRGDPRFDKLLKD